MGNLISLAAVAVVLLMLSMFWHKLLRISPEEGVAAAIMSILLLCFATGLIGIMKLGVYITYALAAIGLVLYVFDIRLFGKESAIKANGISRASLGSFFTPGIVLIMIAFAFAAVAFYGTYLQNWDEYAQWGKSVRHLFTYNALPLNDAAFDGEVEIFTLTSVFHYYFTAIAGFKEFYIYVANFVLWVAGAVLPLSGLGWKKWKSAALYGLILFLAMNILFVQPYYNAYCDQPAAMWAGGFIAWQIRRANDWQKWLLCVFIILFVAMMKNMVGPLFACICAVALGVSALAEWCAAKRELPRGQRPRLIKSWKTAALAIIIVAAPFILTLLWSSLTNTDALFRGAGTAAASQAHRLRLTLGSCLSKLFQSVTLTGSEFSVNYIGYFVFALLVCAVVCRMLKPGVVKNKYKSLYILYLIAMPAFLLLMVYAYMNVFGYVDSINAGSLNRYFSDFIMLSVPVMLIPFVDIADDARGRTAGIKWGVLGALLIYCVLGMGPSFFSRICVFTRGTNKDYTSIASIRKDCERVCGITKEDEKVYFIHQSDNTFPVVVADYALDRRWDRAEDCFYFRENFRSLEPLGGGLVDADLNRLGDIIIEQEYDYVWVYHKDAYLEKGLKKYFHLGSVKSGNLYRAVKSSEGITLELVGNYKG